MGALADNGYPPEKAAIQAIEAGVHVIMLSEKLFGKVAENLMDHAAKDKNFYMNLRKAEKKVLEYKLNAGILKIIEKDGKKKIVPATMEEQLGPVEKRIEQFKRANKEGMDFYKKYFIQGN